MNRDPRQKPDWFELDGDDFDLILIRIISCQIPAVCITALIMVVISLTVEQTNFFGSLEFLVWTLIVYLLSLIFTYKIMK